MGAIFLLRKLSVIEPGWSALLLFVIIFASGFPVRRIAIALSNTLRKRRSKAWLSSDDAIRYREYNEKRESAHEALRIAQESARRAEEERLRRALAEVAKKKDYLLGLSPQAFEEHVGNLFSALGYNVRLTPKSNDEGVDLYLDKPGRRAIVQCKHYTNGNVSRQVVQQTFGVLRNKKVGEAFVVTTGGFTRQAREFAEGKQMHLIDLKMLVEMGESVFTEDFIRSGPTGKTRPSRR